MTPSPTPPSPIPVEGDIQIFANEECTEYPTIGGTYRDLYARVNTPWGIDGEWQIPNVISCWAPSTEDPSALYGIMYVIDFTSDDISRPYTAGEVVKLSSGDDQEIQNDAVFIINKPT